MSENSDTAEMLRGIQEDTPSSSLLTQLPSFIFLKRNWPTEERNSSCEV